MINNTKKQPNITIVDTGISNKASLVCAFDKIGVKTKFTSCANEIENAALLVLPGVGAFGAAMKRLNELKLTKSIRQYALANKPLLAICLGFQLLFDASSETPNIAGIGLITGNIERFSSSIAIPQLGWNWISAPINSRLLKSGYAYFANSFRLAKSPQKCLSTMSYYGENFVSAFETSSILACQFHPELSGKWGLELLFRWCLQNYKKQNSFMKAKSNQQGLCRRIIPCLDIKNGTIVKGINFSNLKATGDPAKKAAQYEKQGADEILILDVSATSEGRCACLKTVRAIRQCISLPLTVGGGVKKLEDVSRLLNAGADKVAINSAALINPSLLRQIATAFGSQCTVLALDVTKNIKLPSNYEVLINSGKTRTGIDAISWVTKAVQLGVGEIVLTSFDRDGTRYGYDIKLIKTIRKAVKIPMVASGGAGKKADFSKAFDAGADAVLAASLFHYGFLNIFELKADLNKQGYSIRL